METNTITATKHNNIYSSSPSLDPNDISQYWQASGLYGLLVRCCTAFGVTMDEVRGRSRCEAYVFARQAYCYMAYRQTNQSAANIGKLIGRDHATVSHSIKTVENYLFANYRRFTDIYNMLLVEG